MKGKKPGSATGTKPGGKPQKVKAIGSDSVGNPAEVIYIFLLLKGEKTA